MIGNDNFSARWTRSYASNPGNYHISVTSDDGSRLYIGGKLVVNNDGLHGMVSDDAILRVVLDSEGELEECVQGLIKAANENGGKDNVTALLLRSGS